MNGEPTILARFLAFQCPACGGRKQSQTAFCGPCYHALPAALKSNLWRRFGEGFEEAYADGLAWLKARDKQQQLFGGQS